MKRFNNVKEKIKNHHLYKRAVESKRFLLLLIVIIILVSYNYFSHGFIYDLANNDLQDTLNFLNAFGSFSWLIYIIIVSLEVLLAPIPGIIMYSSASLIFNPFLGAILSFIGNMVGASIAYLLARRYGGFYFERLVGEKNLANFSRYNEKYGAWVLFILRLNPITSSDMFNYLAGIIQMPYRKFLISTALGLIPNILIISYFGDIFIKESPFLKLFFLVIALIYILILLYGYYKIGKEKVKNKLEKFRK